MITLMRRVQTMTPQKEAMVRLLPYIAPRFVWKAALCTHVDPFHDDFDE